MRGGAGTRVPGPKPSHRIRLDAKEYATLQRLARRRTAPLPLDLEVAEVLEQEEALAERLGAAADDRFTVSPTAV
jgi:hypothetical protein